MEVTDGDHQTRRDPLIIGWTLEHHKQFLESVVRNGGLNKPSITPIVVVDVLNKVNGLRPYPIVYHMFWFRKFHKENESLFKKLPEFDSLVRDFAGLGVEGAKCWSSWTVEHYKEVVEAIIQLGGLVDATPAKLLELVDRRLGLTVEILEHILSRLETLQERTQEATYGHGGPLRPGRQRASSNVVHPYTREKIKRDESTKLATILKSKVDETIMSLRQLTREQIMEYLEAKARATRAERMEYLVTRAARRMENLVTKMDHINLGRSGSESSE